MEKLTVLYRTPNKDSLQRLIFENVNLYSFRNEFLVIDFFYDEEEVTTYLRRDSIYQLDVESM